MFESIAGRLILTALILGAIPTPAADLTVPQQVAHLKPGRKIKVELTTGETMKGRMGSVTEAQFILEPRNKATGTARTIPFAEARSVKTDGLTTGQKWAVAGAVWIAVAIVAARTT
jgi:hypothetical protein